MNLLLLILSFSVFVNCWFVSHGDCDFDHRRSSLSRFQPLLRSRLGFERDFFNRRPFFSKPFFSSPFQTRRRRRRRRNSFLDDVMKDFMTSQEDDFSKLMKEHFPLKNEEHRNNIFAHSPFRSIFHDFFGETLNHHKTEQPKLSSHQKEKLPIKEEEEKKEDGYVTNEEDQILTLDINEEEEEEEELGKELGKEEEEKNENTKIQNFFEKKRSLRISQTIDGNVYSYHEEVEKDESTGKEIKIIKRSINNSEFLIQKEQKQEEEGKEEKEVTSFVENIENEETFLEKWKQSKMDEEIKKMKEIRRIGF